MRIAVAGPADNKTPWFSMR